MNDCAIAGAAIQQSAALERTPLDFVYRREPSGPVDITFVLLDWSCRESYHFLDYLNRQTAPRSSYEVLWIEYYARRSPELMRRLDAAHANGRHPDVDTYVAMQMPEGVYHHKHLMYNLGIVLARGRIVCFCDSDAMADAGLVSSIVEQFAADPKLVLHLDEVRNHDRRFYPFNFPPLEDVVGYGCQNWIDGRPAGLLDTADPLHTRNYGACMCALRNDLIAIGGADLHRDYLGHICGPYEMTFRLVNAGRRELWHPHQWLYHVWHPGEAGDRNYSGPHDGAQMSSRALEARRSGRVLPVEESPAIARWRRGCDEALPATLGDLASGETICSWHADNLAHRRHERRLGDGRILVLESTERGSADGRLPPAKPQPLFGQRFGRAARLRVLPALAVMLRHQFIEKYETRHFNIAAASPRTPAARLVRKLKGLTTFMRRMWAYDLHLTRRCWQTLSYLKATGRHELVLYGQGDAVRLLTAMAGPLGLRVRAACPWTAADQRPPKLPVWTLAELGKWTGPVVIASFVGAAEHVARLQAAGIGRERLIVLE